MTSWAVPSAKTNRAVAVHLVMSHAACLSSPAPIDESVNVSILISISIKYKF